jgi:hypothetical protein
MIGFPCENCGTRLEIGEEYIGQRVACEVCSHAMVVPASTVPDKRTPPPAPTPPPSPGPSSFTPDSFSPDASPQPSYPPGGTTPGPAVSGTGGTNPLAIASLVLGVPGLCCCLTGIPAVICGHIALNQINQSGGVQEGRGFAIAGLILGYLGIAFTVLQLLVSMVSELAQ